MTNRPGRRLLTAFLVCMAGLVAVAGIGFVGGLVAIVTTHGVSMNPVYYQGDLVVVARASSYSVGEIAAYHLHAGKDVALHRIVAGDSEGYVFKGDNNESLDPLKPSSDELVGRAVLHVPQGGVWLERLTSPPMLGVVAFALLASGGTAVTTRHRRKRRKEAPMSRHITDRYAPLFAVGSLPPSLRTPAAIALVLGILGTTLGAFAWTGPLEGPATTEVKSGARMDFSYSADVGKSPAYDGTTATSPDPVFRKLTDTVDVHFAYHGEPGSVTVAGELSTPGGWHSTLQLADASTFTGNQYEGTVRLDLKSLDAKAQAASAATGLAATPVTITLRPHVTTTSGAEFQPELKLNLTPLQLTLAGGEKDLTVADTATVQHSVVDPRTLGTNGWNITAASARITSAVLLFAALATAAIVLVFARKTAPRDEGTAIRRHYAALLVRVHPTPAPPGRPIIDVTTFATLAKLAERYGLLVLHWTRSNVETFIVQDENTTYRYRTGDNPSAPDTAADMAGVQA